MRKKTWSYETSIKCKLVFECIIKVYFLIPGWRYRWKHHVFQLHGNVYSRISPQDLQSRQ